MTRVKPRNSITSRDQAEAAMSRINQIDMQFAAWDLKEATAVSLIREQFAELRKDNNHIGLEAERALLMKELQDWAEVDSQNWEKKTLETPFGKFGFRVSQPAVVLVRKVARSFKHALELLQGKMPEFVRQVPEVDKEAILAAERAGHLDERALKACGLEIKQEDEFWVESTASKDLEAAAKKLRAA